MTTRRYCALRLNPNWRPLLAAISVWALLVCNSINAKALTKSNTSWTIMVYSNGKDDLQKSAACDLYQMLSINGLKNVNIVVQLAFDGDTKSADIGSVKIRCNRKLFIDVPFWRGTRRFIIVDHKPLYVTVPRFTDPRDPRSLEEFVKWARRRFHAHRYMLDLADHGEATALYLDFLQKSLETFELVPPLTSDEYRVRADLIQRFSHVQTALHHNNDHPVVGLFAADTLPLLKDADIRKRLVRVLKEAKLDIIGFDACSKGTLETAYAMKDIAHLMIASQETEPLAGWSYADWLSKLALHPDIDAQQLTDEIMQSYSNEYRFNVLYDTSLATVDLKVLKELIQRFDILASSFIKHPELWPLIHNIREKEIHAYPSDVVDLGTFLSLLDRDLSQDIRYSSIGRVVQEMRQLILLLIKQPPYASEGSRDEHGSTGVSIFFPSASYGDVPPTFYDFHDSSAVPFARDHMWSKFLTKFLADGFHN